MSITEDQTATIEFLAAPSTHGGMPVERVETHISIVFLAGPRAWKLKRAVRLDYIDASTAERRKVLCQKEVALNRRTAPALYVGVVAITRNVVGSLALGGSGTPVDWLVEMTRFDQDALFDRLAERERLDLAMMDELASAIAAFHREAEPRRDHGGTAGMRWVIDGNAAGFSEFGMGLFDPEVVARVIRDTRAALERLGALLESRREAGFVRHGHGDLHLRNIVVYDGHPMLFDGIEFNDEIACSDVLYDLSFLLMDLWKRRLPVHANTVWNRYLAETGDFEGIELLPLFLSCRAAIRAKTNATALSVQQDPARLRALQTSAREYLAMAERLLHPPTPCLVGIGGLSGTGKSALARALAPLLGAVPGAIVFRSDEIRKRICGVPAPTRLGPEGYTADVTRSVYQTLIEHADSTVRNGFTAVVDATFLQLSDREAMETVARNARVPFIGLWLEAPVQTMLDRLQGRESDASDADAGVLHSQLAQDTGALSWHRLDSSVSVEALREAAVSLLGGHVNDAPLTPMWTAIR
jgi:uncharacterized protein